MPQPDSPPTLHSQTGPRHLTNTGPATANAALTMNLMEDFVLGGVCGAAARMLYTPTHNMIVRAMFPTKKHPAYFMSHKNIDLRAINVGLTFMLNDYYKQYVEQPRSAGWLWCLAGNVAAGGAAGATSLAVLHPIEGARRYLAYDVRQSAKRGTSRQFTGLVDCIIKSVRGENGWSRMYRGFTLWCAGVSIYRGAYFGLYDTINDSDAMQDAGFWKKCAVAYAVTVTAMLLSYPLDDWHYISLTRAHNYVIGMQRSLPHVRLETAEEGLRALSHSARLARVFSRGFVGAVPLVGLDYGKQHYLEWKYPGLGRDKQRQTNKQLG